jgi:hypothetical protein
LQVNSGATLQATLSKPATAVPRACVGPPTELAAAAKKLVKFTGRTEISTWRASLASVVV